MTITKLFTDTGHGQIYVAIGGFYGPESSTSVHKSQVTPHNNLGLHIDLCKSTALEINTKSNGTGDH